MSGAERYQIKAEAGWSRTRADGSRYSVKTDTVAGEAEAWACTRLGGVAQDDNGLLSGDEGYDFVVLIGRITVRVDVVHAGFRDTGEPRGKECHLIVNADSPKLYRSDILVLVGGPPFAFLGCIHTARFLGRATLRDHGYGPKLSMAAQDLSPVSAMFRGTT